MATGEETLGPEEVLQSLNYIYHVAFDARAEPTNLVIDDGIGVVEADFVGAHIGEFAGITATNKSVRVPLCLVYEVENDKIKRARIYFETPALFEQLGVAPS
jgi:predicted ester cyclase